MTDIYNSSGSDSFSQRGCCHVQKDDDSSTPVFQHKCCKMDANNWLKDFETNSDSNTLRIAEVRFKNDHKDFFAYSGIELSEGEIVAVEAAAGHDIGIVTLTGDVVAMQMKRKKVFAKADDLRKIYRHAKPSDVEKWLNAVGQEEKALKKTRELIYDLRLDMKLNDVEFQGDKTKAIFYYTADDRVDFRELIKRMAEEFRIRVEMRQIGMRQEAAKLGGIGPCGRELCCASWMSEFQSVSTTVARVQQLSPNPQKLAGLCSKLKCCLNYEYHSYVDAYKGFPDERTILKTKKGDATHQKSDIFKGLMWYAFTNDRSNLLAIPIEKVKSIANDNSKGIIPEKLEDFAFMKDIQTPETSSSQLEGDLKRFDKPKKKNK